MGERLVAGSGGGIKVAFELFMRHGYGQCIALETVDGRSWLLGLGKKCVFWIRFIYSSGDLSSGALLMQREMVHC